MPASRQPVISIRGLSHFFGEGALRKQVLFDLTAEIWPGEIVLITGPSGSGKTTILTLAGALRSVDHGSMRVLGRELHGASPGTLAGIRKNVGFIFQSHNLLDSLTACQNVQMSLGPQRVAPREAHQRALAMLAAVGLSDRAGYLPEKLSGGQRQRVAIARALVRSPKIVLADEPTAALDKQSGREVVELLRQLARKQGCAVLMVTHDNRILDIADRIMLLEDGRLTSFAAALSADAGHLLTVLSRVSGREALSTLLDRMAEGEFYELLVRMTSEFEQFLNVTELVSRRAVRTLFEDLLETVAGKVREIVQAETTALFLVDGRRRGLLARGAGGGPNGFVPAPENHPAGSAVTSGAIVNRRAAGETALCLPLFDRQERLFGVIQFAGKAEGAPFSAADERTLADFARPIGMILEACECLGRMQDLPEPGRDEARTKTV